MVVNFFVQNISPDPAFNPELLFWEPFGFMTEKNVRFKKNLFVIIFLPMVSNVRELPIEDD